MQMTTPAKKIDVGTTIVNHVLAINMVYFFDHLDVELPLSWQAGNKPYQLSPNLRTIPAAEILQFPSDNPR